MERGLPFDIAALKRARARLVAKDLVAFRPWRAKSIDGSYQVLSLPEVRFAAHRTGGVASLGEVLSGTFEKQR